MSILRFSILAQELVYKAIRNNNADKSDGSIHHESNAGASTFCFRKRKKLCFFAVWIWEQHGADKSINN